MLALGEGLVVANKAPYIHGSTLVAFCQGGCTSKPAVNTRRSN